MTDVSNDDDTLVIYIDFETHAQMNDHMGEVLFTVYKVGDESVRIVENSS